MSGPSEYLPKQWPTSPGGGPVVGAGPTTSGQGPAGKPPGRKRVRWLPVVFGVLGILFGVLVLVIGFVIYLANAAVSVLDADAEGRMPHARMELDAEDGQYDIFISGRGATDTEALGIVCQITLADGEEQEVRGDRQAVGESGAIDSVGSFDAVEGPTVVDCQGEDSANARIYVDRQRAGVELVAWITIGAGVLILLAGIGLLLFGALVRKPPRA